MSYRQAEIEGAAGRGNQEGVSGDGLWRRLAAEGRPFGWCFRPAVVALVA